MGETLGTSTSICHFLQKLGLSIDTCITILRKDLHLFPYRLTSVHELDPSDFLKRVQFYQSFLNTLDSVDHLEKCATPI